MGEETKVVLDTNVYVSAFGWGGKPDDYFQLVLDGEVQNYVSPKILDEVSDVYLNTVGNTRR
jgi:putative PIN family toxin of toxin-antitoxin system